MINLNFNKLFLNKFWDYKKFISYFFTAIFIVLSFSVISFIFYQSIYFFKEEGWKGFGYLIDSKWKPSNKKFGISNFIVSTFYTVLISLLVVIKFNLFVSIFISRFLFKKLKKIILFILKIFSGIPSVLFGVFVLFTIGPLLGKIHNGAETSMLSAIIVLVIMTLPSTIVLTVNLLDSVSIENELSGLAIGINKITVIFDIVKKVCIKSIKVIIFFGFCRIIGEVSAISMVAGGGSGMIPFDKFSGFFFASIRTLTTLIGLEFKENASKLHESSLFVVSLILLIFVLISNVLFTFLNNKNENKKWTNKLNKFNLLNNSKKYQNFTLNKLSKIRFFKNRFLIKYRKINMFFLFMLVFSFLIWMIGDILIKGLKGYMEFEFKDFSFFSGETGIFGIILTTFILIVATLMITIPLALFTAVFITEYSNNYRITRIIAKISKFIVLQLSSVPTILFGMFGLSLFVVIFGFGLTILSGACTMILIIFPIMVQTIIQNLKSISEDYRYSGYALGLSQKTIVWKIIIPMAMKGIFISIVLGINKIIAESAPLLIVMGNSTFAPESGIFSNGRTLASHIVLLNSESPLSVTDTEHVIYQTALVILLFVVFLNYLVFKIENKNSKI